MNTLRTAWQALQSLLLMLAAAATLVAVAWASGELATAMQWPRGVDARLRWDLGGVAVAGILAFAVLARWAPASPAGHVVAGLVLLAAVLTWAVAELGGDFPVWFSTILLLSLPVQAWTGWRLGRRNR